MNDWELERLEGGAAAEECSGSRIDAQERVDRPALELSAGNAGDPGQGSVASCRLNGPERWAWN